MSIQFFLRFGQLIHLQQLLSLGHIYIKNAKYFKQDSPHQRFDKNEGKLSIAHISDKVLEIRPKGEIEWKKLIVPKGKLEYSMNLKHTYIYSLFSILEIEARQSEFFEFSEEIKTMGDHYILINNPREFMKRIVDALEKTSYYYEHGFVNYYNAEENHKKLGLFHKENKYQNQKEYRIAISLDYEQEMLERDYIEFKIGSIEDIAEICATDDYKGLQFKWE